MCIRDSHVYATAGSFTVTVTVSDQENLSGSSQGTITVSDAPPSVEIGASAMTIDTGTTTMTMAVITDGLGETHTAQINWGDGSVESVPVQNRAIGGEHTYTVPGTYTAIFTVTDSQGVQGTDSIVFTVIGPNSSIKIPAANKWTLLFAALLIGSVFIFRSVKSISRN